MRTLEIITAEYNAAVAALKAKQEEFDAPVEGEEPPAEGQTRAYSVEQEAEIKTLLESAEALKKEMDDFVPPTVSDADRQAPAAARTGIARRTDASAAARHSGRASADTQHGADRAGRLL